MIVFLLITCLIVSLIANIATVILIKNLLTKINTYESWILEFKQDVSATLVDMRAIDSSGTFKSSFNSSGQGNFESDDQVGTIFKELLNLIEKLDDKIQ